MDLKTIGANCRKWRVSSGISQKEMADITGCTQSTISKFEQGKLNNALFMVFYLKLGMKVKDLTHDS